MARGGSNQGVVDFGRGLLETGDLAPVYVALHGMVVGGKVDAGTQLKRWLVAYWCFYHCGAASYLSEFEGRDFWRSMAQAAANEVAAPTGGRWPRGAERRHFRGAASVRAVRALSESYDSGEEMFNYVVGPWSAAAKPFAEVAGRARENPLFGPWISFKVCDMVERLGYQPVDFDEAAVFMFKDPARAADMVWEQYVGPLSKSKVPELERRHRVVERLCREFEDYRAPPRGDRAVNIQEVETVLCKWKSHRNGHYPLGKDIREIRHGLSEWADRCQTAFEMRSHMPPEVEA